MSLSNGEYEILTFPRICNLLLYAHGFPCRMTVTSSKIEMTLNLGSAVHAHLPSTKFRRNNRNALSASRGFGLLELMVSLALAITFLITVVGFMRHEKATAARALLVRQQAADMALLSRALEQHASTIMLQLSPGVPTPVEPAALVTAQLIPANLSTSPGSAGPTSPIGQPYLLWVSKSGSDLQTAVVPSGSPSDAMMARAGLSNTPASVSQFHAEVVRSLRSRSLIAASLVSANSSNANREATGFDFDFAPLIMNASPYDVPVAVTGFKQFDANPPFKVVAVPGDGNGPVSDTVPNYDNRLCRISTDDCATHEDTAFEYKMCEKWNAAGQAQGVPTRYSIRTPLAQVEVTRSVASIQMGRPYGHPASDFSTLNHLPWTYTDSITKTTTMGSNCGGMNDGRTWNIETWTRRPNNPGLTDVGFDRDRKYAGSSWCYSHDLPTKISYPKNIMSTPYWMIPFYVTESINTTLVTGDLSPTIVAGMVAHNQSGFPTARLVGIYNHCPGNPHAIDTPVYASPFSYSDGISSYVNHIDAYRVGDFAGVNSAPEWRETLTFSHGAPAVTAVCETSAMSNAATVQVNLAGKIHSFPGCPLITPPAETQIPPFRPMHYFRFKPDGAPTLRVCCEKP